MAGDMVASVTLRLRDQMSVGIDQIKEQFGSVQATLDRLTGVMDRLQGTMDALRMPAQMNMALGGTVTEADAAATAVSSIGLAAAANITRFTEMNAALNKWTASGGAIPPGIGATSPVPPDMGGAPQMPGEPGLATSPRSRPESAAHSEAAAAGTDFLTDAIMGAITVGAGLDAIKKLATYHSWLRHAAIAEHLDGAPNKLRVEEVSGMLNRIALHDRQSSLDLAQAYYFLATTQMKPTLINALMPAVAKTSTAYNTNPTLMANAAFQLSDNFKIPADQMQTVLAQMAYAAKMAHYNVEDFGAGLPALGGNAELAGLTGQHGFDVLAAALETVRKNVYLSSEATTDVNDLLGQLHSQMVNRTFDQALFKNTLKVDQPLYAKYGIKPIDLRSLENNAAAHGIDPLTAVMDYIHKTVKPMTKTDEAFFVSSLFGNQQSRTAVLSLLEHWKSNHAMIKTLGGVDKNTVATDFKTAMSGADTQLRLLDENLSQVYRNIGSEVLPALKGFTGALTFAQNWLNPKGTEKLSPVERKAVLEGTIPAIGSVPFAPNDKDKEAIHQLMLSMIAQTRAAKENTEALRQGHMMGAHVNAHPIGPTQSPGPVLGRP